MNLCMNLCMNLSHDLVNLLISKYFAPREAFLSFQVSKQFNKYASQHKETIIRNYLIYLNSLQWSKHIQSYENRCSYCNVPFRKLEERQRHLQKCEKRSKGYRYKFTIPDNCRYCDLPYLNNYPHLDKCRLRIKYCHNKKWNNCDFLIYKCKEEGYIAEMKNHKCEIYCMVCEETFYTKKGDVIRNHQFTEKHLRNKNKRATKKREIKRMKELKK